MRTFVSKRWCAWGGFRKLPSPPHGSATAYSHTHTGNIQDRHGTWPHATHTPLTRKRTHETTYRQDQASQKPGQATRRAERATGLVIASTEALPLRKKFGTRHENAYTEALPLRKKFAPRRENASTEAFPLRSKFAPRREYVSTASLQH